ncbi:glycine oxidase ThiO [Thiobacillus sp.]
MRESDHSGTKPSIIVLGAGISGLSAALALLKRGHDVTLLERGDVGAEASWAGGGILSPLLPWDYGETLSALTLRSMVGYAEWVADVEAQSGRVAEYWRCGMQVMDVAEPDRAIAWCEAHDVTIERRAFQTGEGLWLPGIAQVRNPRLVVALREAVVRLGGVIHTRDAVETVVSRAGHLVAVRTAQATYTADRFILATGAWSGIALPDLAGVPNIRPIRGQILLFRLEPGMLDTILYRKGLYLIPRRDGHVLVGSTVEDAGFDKTIDEATRRRLHSEAAELLPVLAGLDPVQHWAGLRPGSPGNIPVIDRHPHFDNVFVNVGHYRYGVTMAPAAVELLMDLMEDNPPALDPAPYRWQAALERRWTDAL